MTQVYYCVVSVGKGVKHVRAGSLLRSPQAWNPHVSWLHPHLGAPLGKDPLPNSPGLLDRISFLGAEGPKTLRLSSCQLITTPSLWLLLPGPRHMVPSMVPSQRSQLLSIICLIRQGPSRLLLLWLTQSQSVNNLIHGMIFHHISSFYPDCKGGEEESWSHLGILPVTCS